MLGWVYFKSSSTPSPAQKSPAPAKPPVVVRTNAVVTPVLTNHVPAASTNVIVTRTNAVPSNAVPEVVTLAVTTNLAPFREVQTNLPPAPPPVVVPPPPPANGRKVKDVFEAQVALSAIGISPGSLDGVLGSQTKAALRVFQRLRNLTPTGQLDAATRSQLLLQGDPITLYEITSNDLARLRVVSTTWLGKSQQDRLDYETILELVAEKGHAYPAFIRHLNPDINWNTVQAGTVVRLPAVAYPTSATSAASIHISLSERTLQVFDAQTNLLAHYPVSIAKRVEKRPVGVLHVQVIAPNPNYVFAPENFPESAEAQELDRKLVLPPGPNNPVGAMWIGLDKPGYGIHGTPKPEEVGRTESHGCFRLANWNAEHLASLIVVGTPVTVDP